MADRATLRRTAVRQRGSQGTAARAAEKEERLERTQPLDERVTTARKLDITPVTVLNQRLKNNDAIMSSRKDKVAAGNGRTAGGDSAHR